MNHTFCFEERWLQLTFGQFAPVLKLFSFIRLGLNAVAIKFSLFLKVWPRIWRILLETIEIRQNVLFNKYKTLSYLTQISFAPYVENFLIF